MRTEGKSYATIGKAIGVERSLEVFGLFVDTIAARPARERAQLRAEENQRLDAIERRNAKITDEAVRNRREASLQKLRARLIAIA
jgi:hypothetical protein